MLLGLVEKSCHYAAVVVEVLIVERFREHLGVGLLDDLVAGVLLVAIAGQDGERRPGHGGRRYAERQDTLGGESQFCPDLGDAGGERPHQRGAELGLLHPGHLNARARQHHLQVELGDVLEQLEEDGLGVDVVGQALVRPQLDNQHQPAVAVHLLLDLAPAEDGVFLVRLTRPSPRWNSSRRSKTLKSTAMLMPQSLAPPSVAALTSSSVSRLKLARSIRRRTRRTTPRVSCRVPPAQRLELLGLRVGIEGSESVLELFQAFEVLEVEDGADEGAELPQRPRSAAGMPFSLQSRSTRSPLRRGM